MTQLVSVVMPAFNAAEFIGQAILSVLEQSYEHWELIIVDDGSTDATSEVISGFADDRIFYIFQENSGVAAARNRAIKSSRGNFIAFLDADDLWNKEKLALQIEAFRLLGNDVGLVYSDYLCFENGSSKTYKPKRPAKLSASAYNNLLTHNYIATLTVMVRKNSMALAGVFDSKYFGTEDWDLWLRILRTTRAHKLDRPLAKYRVHKGGISKNLLFHYSQEVAVLKENAKFIQLHERDCYFFGEIFLLAKLLFNLGHRSLLNPKFGILFLFKLVKQPKTIFYLIKLIRVNINA
ncbi:glycosyltransferase [Alphaproteobacteria bacterium]|nr:glycosyltransferase [Alphaproteobacteria bacterium]